MNSDGSMQSGTLCEGKVYLAKNRGHFFMAFVPTGEEDRDCYPNYCFGNETVIARMLYAHGLVSEPQLFKLVEDGEESVIHGSFPDTLIIAMYLGLAEVPNSISDICMDIATFFEPPGTRRLAQ